MDGTQEFGPISEQIKSPEDQEYVDTYQFGDEFVSIRARRSDFQRNFEQAAIEQGSSPEAAKEASERVNIVIGECPSNQSEPVVYLLRKILPSSLHKNIPKMALAEVRMTENGATCYMDIEAIVKNLINERSFESFPIPEDLPEEAKKMALVQVLDATWRHERQHFIQKLLKEPTGETPTNPLDLPLAARVQGGFMLAQGLAAICVPLTNIPNAGVVEGSVLLGTALAGKLFKDSLDKTFDSAYKNNKYEKPAFEQKKAEYFKGNSPFQVSFEK